MHVAWVIIPLMKHVRKAGDVLPGELPRPSACVTISVADKMDPVITSKIVFGRELVFKGLPRRPRKLRHVSVPGLCCMEGIRSGRGAETNVVLEVEEDS